MAHDRADLSVRVARLVSPVTALGPGRRVVLWVQGCALACPGCASVDTWDPLGGRTVALDELTQVVGELLVDQALDGLTITGGEPTDQARALGRMVDRLRLDFGLSDVLVFTGRPSSGAWRAGWELLSRADVVVAGPYRPQRPPASRLQATDNQTVEFVTPTARGTYREWMVGASQPLQVVVDGPDVMVVGLPRAGELETLRTQLQGRGVVLGSVTWQP